MESRTSTMQNLSMQRRHFQMIADVVNGSRLVMVEGDYMRGYDKACKDIAESFASRLASTNPGFDRARFLAACGME